MSSEQYNEQSHFDDYTIEETASALLDELPPKVITYFNNSFESNCIALSEFLTSNWITNDNIVNVFDNNISLQTIVEYVLWESLVRPPKPGFQPLNEREALEHYVQLRKSRKDYLYRTIRREIPDNNLEKKPRTTRFLEESWEALNNPYLKAAGDSSVPNITKEEYMAQELEKVTKWHHDNDSFLFEFPYFDVLPAKRRVACFIQDVGWQIFLTICTKFYRQKFGFVTRSPDANFGMHQVPGMENAIPLVNWQSSAISVNNLKYEATDSSVMVYELFRMGEGAELRYIVEIIDNLDCSTSEKKEHEIARIRNEYLTQKRVGHLDSTDFAIYTAILNNMTYDIATGKSDLIITFMELAHDVYGSESSISLKKCTSLFKRLQKLQDMRISSSLQDENKVPIHSSVVTFFTFEHGVYGDFATKGSRSKSKSLSESKMSSVDFKFAEIDMSGNAIISNVELLTKSHYNNMILKITPSDYMKSEWQQGIHSSISSSAYQNITSQKGKMLLQLLQKERLKAYPAVSVNINCMDLLAQIKISSGTERRFKNEVIQELDNFKELGIVVDDYSLTRNTFHIIFIPLSEKEKIMFKIKNSKFSEN